MARVPYLAGRPEARTHILQAVSNSDTALRALHGFTAVMRGKGQIAPRLRELVVLRVACAAGAPYVWSRHVEIAREAGVPDAAIVAVREGRWDELESAEAAACRFAEAVNREAMTDELWSETGEHFGDAELVELVLWAGFYSCMPRVVAALAIDPEDELTARGFGEPEG